MNQSRHPGNCVPGLWLLFSALVVIPVAAAPAIPFTPQDDSEIIEHLSRGPRTPAENQWRRRLALEASPPADAPSALQIANGLIHEARSAGDPRFLGQAEAVLQPWWEEPHSPAEVLVLKATIQQGRHEFGPALLTLNSALRRDPRSISAWLTKATIHSVRGEFVEARRACLALSRVADPMTALVAAASVTGINGSPSAALDAIETQLSQSRQNKDVEFLVWAETIAAEMADRAGRDEVATRHFTHALCLAPSDPYVLSTWADFQLFRGNTQEVVERLQPWTRSDAVLLRYAEALSRSTGADGLAERARAISELEDRIEAMRRRGSRVHLREEARYELHLRQSAAKALSLATANWEVQREPVDWRLWIESARAAGDHNSEMAALNWASTNRYEDPRWGTMPPQQVSLASPSLPPTPLP